MSLGLYALTLSSPSSQHATNQQQQPPTTPKKEQPNQSTQVMKDSVAKETKSLSAEPKVPKEASNKTEKAQAQTKSNAGTSSSASNKKTEDNTAHAKEDAVTKVKVDMNKPQTKTNDANNNEDDDQEKLNTLEAKVRQQGEIVRTLKKEGKPFDVELQKLASFKAERDVLKAKIDAAMPKFDAEGLQNLILRRMLVVPAFEIHGGTGGLFDFGPPGAGLKEGVLDVWKRHFIVREGMLQVDCTNLTPHSVLLASGHVERFNDLLCEELNEDGSTTGEYHRADKIVEAKCEELLSKLDESIRSFVAGNNNGGLKKEDLEAEADRLRKLANKAGSLSVDEMHKVITELGIRGNPPQCRVLSAPRPFNLMFATTIGPSAAAKAYLRPETAQGIFVNFKRLLDYNYGKVPFAAAQIGTGFRNEIAPKNGLIRVREFCMAEIEHFVHPKRKEHPRFSEIADVILQLFTGEAQLTTFKMEFVSAGEAVKRKMINNETLAYFMARTQQFMLKIGIDPKRLRFRQHLPTEMAHYASDCYDAEILLSTGWLECAGHADRACYDLEAHSKATGIELKAAELLKEPRLEKIVELRGVMSVIGSTFRKDAPLVAQALSKLSPEEAEAGDAKLSSINGVLDITLSDGRVAQLKRNQVVLHREERKVFEDRFYPAVIEPSFGIGRIIYSLLEHSYWVRREDSSNKVEEEEEDRDLSKLVRNVLSFPPAVAAFKVGFIPYGLSNDVEGCRRLLSELNDVGLSGTVDPSSNSIGRKYARLDEIGIPFAVTLDDETAQNGSYTLRERDTEEQIRVPKEFALAPTIKALCDGHETWATLRSKFPVVRAASTSGRPGW